MAPGRGNCIEVFSRTLGADAGISLADSYGLAEWLSICGATSDPRDLSIACADDGSAEAGTEERFPINHF